VGVKVRGPKWPYTAQNKQGCAMQQAEGCAMQGACLGHLNA